MLYYLYLFSDIHYFHCKDIANVLAGTEDGARNVFGGYSSKRMNDWMEIIKMYERNNVFIAECARLLSTSVYFDVPALRKKIQKLEQMQQVYIISIYNTISVY